MADAAAASGDERLQKASRQGENSSGISGSGLSGEESRAAVAEAEDSAQNGGRCEKIRSDEELLLGASAAAAAAAVEDRASPVRGLHKITVSAAHEQLQPPPQQLNDGLGVSLPKASEDLPPKRNFQIPRKSKAKKALFQQLSSGSREFDDVVNILQSAYLDCNSKSNFVYKKACLVHCELLEKDFIEKRRELKQDGRSEKELAESYAFLKVDRALVQNICENGLQVGHSKMTVLGSPSMGVYLSRYADLLQANTLDPRAEGDVMIFKVIKGRMKSICDTLGVKPMDSSSKSALDPTPKHECHVLKNSNKIISLLSYRAYERSQYYFYEYGFDEIRQRPRHVCPYACVSFSYKDEKVPKYLPPSRSKISSMDKADKGSYTLWKGQLLNRGTLVCHVALKSETRPVLPCKLPEKLDVDMVMRIEHLTRKISPKVFYKETYSGEKEEFRSGLYCSLYEVVEKTRLGSNLEGLIQKLEKDKLVIVKPLVDGGYLLLLSPSQMASPYDNQAGRPHILQALFLFRNHRGVGISTQKHDQKNASTSVRQDMHMVMPDLTRFIQALHYAFLHSRKDPKSDLNIAVEKHIHHYLKQYSRFKQFILYEYKPTLDEKRFLHAGPKNKSNLDSALRAYIFGSEAYQIPVSKAKKMMDGNRKPQQFSPVSDYEALEEESDCSKRAIGKRNGSKGEMIDAQKKHCHGGDYDEESIQELINLIQCKKKNVDRESDTEDNRSKSRSKRKLESSMESPQKRLKNSTSSEKDCHYDGERTSESLSSMIADLGGRDTDLRQQNVSDPPVAEKVIVKKLLDVLTVPGLVARFLNHALAENNTRQPPEYESIPAQAIEEPELPDAAHNENVQLKDSQNAVMFETTAPCLPYSVDVCTNEAGMDHMLHLKETSTGSVSSFDGCSSPCPSTPLEQKYHRQHSNSNNTGETAMNWKLIPITGGAGRFPEKQLREHGDNQTGLKSPGELLAYSPPKDASQDDPRVINRQKMSDYSFIENSVYDIQKGIEDGAYTSQEERLEGQHEFAANHCISGIIEKAILDEYKHFTNKIQETLQQKNIMYVSGIAKPMFSAKERVMRLSQYICLQASDIAVQEYIEALSEKLNKVALSSYGILHAPYTCSSTPANDLIINNELNLSSEEPLVPAPAADDFDMDLVPELLDNNAVEDSSINEQKPLVTLDTGKEQSPVRTSIETKQAADGNLSSADPLQQPDKPQRPTDNVTVTTQPVLTDLITQMKPEMFDSIVKIIEDVRKNTVKFYIHEEQESTLCKGIKEYLIKLGNTECHPEQFLRRRADLDKLLIIIQNEDIASHIHKIPCLVTLKRLSCVSFAGVDSLNDVQNRTYHELFVSGGFIVSDETVLNPEFITVDQLDSFLKFLEEMSAPDGKWQWKVHCKMQKKLKELGRINANANANALLTLLNAYQKKHVVEILSYHNCDSQTRNAPELDCLINLQAQNLQRRHTVFLTEKNVQAFGNYTENGIVVTTVDNFMHNFKSLVGYHNSVTEENNPTPPVDHDRQSVLIENDGKDEEDMSLDSGDEASQIEVCSDVSKHDSHLEALRTETKGSHGADCQQNSQLDTELSAEGRILVTEKTSNVHVQDIQPVTPVSTTCSTEGGENRAAEQVPFKNFQIYNRQLSVPHQFSHFNVLTHQTFLGATYPISTNRNQESGNYFLTAYSQNMDMHQSSSPRNWDVSCDSSRPYSKQN